MAAPGGHVSDINESTGVVGDPLMQGAAAPEFVIEADVRRHYYTAASHRPLVRSIRITNARFSGDAEEMVISVHAEAVGAPSLLTPWRRMYQVPRRHDSIDIDVLTLRPNMIQLASLDELVRGDVVVSISIDGNTVETARYPVEFLAYNQWFHSQLDYECLSSFVLPNHPVVTDVMLGVRDRLKADTGDGSTQGYQSGPIRVLAIVRAIYEELQARGLKYSDPPASFEGYGQKIRTPDVIMREQVMTCLDSTVMVASCLAAAGITPLLFLVKGHAFPGFWISPDNDITPDGTPLDNFLRDSVILNINRFQLLDSAGMIGSLESTCIGMPQKPSFAEAFNRHKDFSAGGDIGDFEAFIDVERASMTGVRRLPSRTVNPANGATEVIEDDSVIEVPRVRPDEVVLEGDASDREKLSKGDVPARVRRWMDALLDISNTNPLVNLASAETAVFPDKKRRASRSIEIPMVQGLLGRVENAVVDGRGLRLVSTFDLPGTVLQDPSPGTITAHFDATNQIGLASVEQTMQLVEAVIQKEIEAGIPPAQAEFKVARTFAATHGNEIARRFRSLKKLADEIEAESATNQLFLTIGSLLWESPGDTASASRVVKSPLFVIPVRISSTSKTSFSVQMEESGEITPNYCLMEKLRHELGLRISDLETPNLDESGIDVDNMIARIRAQLGASKFASMLVVEDCQLAVLDFATFRMWKDLQSNWRTFTRNEVVAHLVNGTNATLAQELPQYSGEPLTPFDCDESQIKAVRWALEGRSFVLEGPPGTGKSQTIANMIAAGMAEGKRILFVAEKHVALEAVSRKLEEIGLDPFCITMHHENTTPESIRAQLQLSLDFVGNDLSVQWNSETAVVASLRDRLNQYRESLVIPNDLGSNALMANQEVIRLGDGPSVDVDPSTLPLIGEHFGEIRSALLQIRGVAGVSRIAVAPEWSLAVVDDPESLSKQLLAGAIEELRTLMTQHGTLRPLIEPLMESTTTGGLNEAVEAAVRLVASGNAPTLDVAATVTDPAWIARFDSLKTMVEAHKLLHRAVFDFFAPTAFTMDVTPQMTAAQEAISAGLFAKKRKAETLKALVAPLARGTVDKEPAELLTLLQQLAPAREGLRHIVDQYRAVAHLDVRHDFDPMNESHVAEVLATAQDLRSRSACLLHPDANVVRTLLSSNITFNVDDVPAMNRVIDIWATVKRLMGSTSDSVDRWRAGRSLWESISQSMDAWTGDSPHFTILSRNALVNQTLAPLRAAGQHTLVDSILAGDTALDDLHDEFERGVFRAARDERLAQGALATFDRGQLDKVVADFTRRDHNRRTLMRTVIPRQLSESRPFKPGVRTGAIGNLERELGRKVRRVSIPKLIKEHGEMITRLTPCFLMSPEAVSRLLPAESQYFDLVIFDEASQIRVAAAIPAMGRGKAVVVVGDSKQMPPSKKVGQRQVSSEETSSIDDDGVLQDLESILSECSESHLPSLMLQCHFRSQHEGLIAFSNRNFYDSKLVTFPAPNSDKTTPVSWIDVPDGQFLRSGEGKGTNPAEARAVVAEITRRLSSPEHGSKSIGVVTFNEYQAAHIYELLEELAATDPAIAAAMNHPKRSERLFVVPLEKVQGDERDTIMISVSYSYQGHDRKKVSPTWGPLTYKGGERRLNVAITRAKKDLVVVCSFDPNHVVTGNSSHLGVPATVEFLKECRAAAVTNGAALKSRSATNIDRYRKRLHDQLREAGVKVRENVGLSKFRIDLAVSDDEGESQFLALLLDSEEWASRSTAYDREVLPNSVLRLIGWRRIGRVWLKATVEDPSLVVQTVRNELARERTRVHLIETLRERGFEVRDDTALSKIGVDFAVRRSGQTRWPLAVSLAGPGLFAQYFTYDGDVPRGDILKSVSCTEGLSVWIPDIDADLESAIARIDSTVDRVSRDMEFDEPEPADQPATPSDMTSVAEPGSNPAPTGTALLTQSEYWSEFTDARSLPVIGDQSVLGPGVGYNPSTVRKAIDEVVEFEGPITEERLGSIVVGRFGMSRLKAARLEALRPLFRHLSSSTSPFGVVYWPSHRPADGWMGFRTSTGESSRDIEDVPAEELANAMVAVVRMGDTATQEEILRFIADAHGRKLTEKVRTRLVSVLAWTVENGRLTFDGAFYKMPGQ